MKSISNGTGKFFSVGDKANHVSGKVVRIIDISGQVGFFRCREITVEPIGGGKVMKCGTLSLSYL